MHQIELAVAVAPLLFPQARLDQVQRHRRAMRHCGFVDHSDRPADSMMNIPSPPGWRRSIAACLVLSCPSPAAPLRWTVTRRARGPPQARGVVPPGGDPPRGQSCGPPISRRSDAPRASRSEKVGADCRSAKRWHSPRASRAARRSSRGSACRRQKGQMYFRPWFPGSDARCMRNPNVTH